MCLFWFTSIAILITPTVNLFPLKCTVLKAGIFFFNYYIDNKQTLSGME